MYKVGVKKTNKKALKDNEIIIFVNKTMVFIFTLWLGIRKRIRKVKDKVVAVKAHFPPGV